MELDIRTLKQDKAYHVTFRNHNNDIDMMDYAIHLLCYEFFRNSPFSIFIATEWYNGNWEFVIIKDINKDNETEQKDYSHNGIDFSLSTIISNELYHILSTDLHSSLITFNNAISTVLKNTPIYAFHRYENFVFVYGGRSIIFVKDVSQTHPIVDSYWMFDESKLILSQIIQQ